MTAACAFPATNLFKKLLDVEGYNYMEKLYAADHAADPARVLYGSENSHSLAAWQAVAENDYISGQFLWTGIDYLGEAGVWPSHASGSGLLDLAGFPKPQYYFRKSLWTDEPMVYLTMSAPDERIRAPDVGIGGAYCYTNCDRVELFQDGKSVGSKPQTARRIICWPVVFTSGVLRAVGTKGGQQVTFELKKAGAAAKLVLRRLEWRKRASGPPVPAGGMFGKPAGDPSGELQAGDPGDGPYVAQIEVDVTDKDGTLAEDAGNLITSAVTGPARIIGIENGDTNDAQDYKALLRKAYRGRMLIYVQALGVDKATLTVSTPGLEGASITLPHR